MLIILLSAAVQNLKPFKAMLQLGQWSIINSLMFHETKWDQIRFPDFVHFTAPTFSTTHTELFWDLVVSWATIENAWEAPWKASPLKIRRLIKKNWNLWRCCILTARIQLQSLFLYKFFLWCYFMYIQFEHSNFDSFPQIYINIKVYSTGLQYKTIKFYWHRLSTFMSLVE